MRDHIQMMVDTAAYLEEHMGDELSIEQVAEHFHYSVFHYARLFKEVMGENLGDYQRKRRMTLAAERLLHSSQGILEIALDCGYHSQEAFTRVFKVYFGMTPGTYREKGVPFYNLYKYQPSREDIEALAVQCSMNYEIVHKPAFEVTGLFYHGSNQKHEVARVFNEVVERLDFKKIYGQVDGLYGLEYNCSERICREEFDFIAGVNSAYAGNAPGLVKKAIPENDYAVFEMTPMIEKIRSQVHAIYMEFLKSGEYQLCGKYAFEFYPKGFIPNHKDRNAYLYLPVKK